MVEKSPLLIPHHLHLRYILTIITRMMENYEGTPNVHPLNKYMDGF